MSIVKCKPCAGTGYLSAGPNLVGCCVCHYCKGSGKFNTELFNIKPILDTDTINIRRDEIRKFADWLHNNKILSHEFTEEFVQTYLDTIK